MEFLVYEHLSAITGILKHERGHNVCEFVCKRKTNLTFCTSRRDNSSEQACHLSRLSEADTQCFGSVHRSDVSNQILVTRGNGSVNHALTPQGLLLGSFLSD